MISNCFRNFLVLVLFFLASFERTQAQDQGESQSNAEKIASEQARAYAAAFAKRSPVAVSQLFADEAEYTLDTGQVIRGRKAIEERLEEAFSASADVRIEIVTESARFLAPNVLIEKGYSTLLGGDEPEVTRYVATQVRVGEKWLIADLQEFTLPAADEGIEAMSALSWIVGEWKAVTDGIDATMSASWTLDGRFITRVAKINRDGGNIFSVVDIIGYDPSRRQIRSWTFDDEGGFGEGLWRLEENKWLVRSKATLPKGGQSSGQHIITLLGEDLFGFESINRVLDGEMLPNLDRIELRRLKKTATSDSK